jgi:AcrR family transcriptional regulator
MLGGSSRAGACINQNHMLTGWSVKIRRVPQVVRPYRGVSADDRRAERRARLIEAALDVLGSEGLAKTTMTAVCARAGLTERYFYESFRDRDELLVALFDRFAAEMWHAALAALEPAPPELLARCRAAAAAIITPLTDDARLARAYVEALGSEALKARRLETVRAFAGLLAEQMRQLHGLPDKRPAASLKLVTVVIIGGVSDAVTEWLDGRLELSRDQLVEECARLCVAAAEAVRDT